jgi:predicted ATPase with chaperone activity
MTIACGNLTSGDPTLVSMLLGGEQFWPTDPRSLDELGIPETFLEGLISRTLLSSGNSSGRGMANAVKVPFRTVERILERLKARRLVTHCGSASLNDYVYTLSDEGRKRAQASNNECAYVGPAPVPLSDYILSVEAQAICDQAIRRTDLVDAFYDISISEELLDLIGPAVNSSGGLFLYGAPGNGKSTLARKITACFGQEIWLPHAVVDGTEIIKVFDPAFHEEGSDPPEGGGWDRRWLRVRRPTVVVGGELTLDNLEIRHDRSANVCEAPLQMKSNCGCLLIDDFGRQRISPEDLLNRWIVPLENHHDFLTLPSGKKIQVPFQQLIIFSTNLDPAELVDEAFLRRIPYRIEVGDPDESEFKNLFQIAADRLGCEFDSGSVDHLLQEYYQENDRPMRRCHPRDLLLQVRHYCTYNDIPFEMRPEFFDKVASGFFTPVQTRALRPGTSRAGEHTMAGGE